MKTRELAYTGILAALIAVCSWISIPTAVPFTLPVSYTHLDVYKRQVSRARTPPSHMGR